MGKSIYWIVPGYAGPEVRVANGTRSGLQKQSIYISDVSYRFDIREVAGESAKIWGYVEIVGGIQDQFGYGDEYTLRLDNGRPIEIVIKTLNFNSGEYLVADKSAE